MSTSSAGAEDAKRRALELLDTFLADAKASGSAGAAAPAIADLKRVLGELRTLDPAIQRRVARAMVESRGDPAALRAAIEAPASGSASRAEPVAIRTPPRTPTVVDGRGGVSWRGIAVAAIAAAITAALIAGSRLAQ